LSCPNFNISGETEIQGTEILKKEEILDAKIAKFLSVRLKRKNNNNNSNNNNHYCSSHFYSGERELGKEMRERIHFNFLMIGV